VHEEVAARRAGRRILLSTVRLIPVPFGAGPNPPSEVPAVRRFLICCAAVLLPVLAAAAPTFEGVKEALPAPHAAVLRWDRAREDNARGSVTYLVFQRGPNGWDMSRPLAEVKGNEWVLTGLQGGREYEFAVRARGSSGTDQNTRSVKVRPTNSFPAAEFRGA
jgi:hypothetical protein